eukprot:6102517-Alexandrium_andersonii.AAC.1
MQFKFHMMTHIAHAAARQGNPWHYTTFEDEAYNGKLVPIAAAAHASSWHRRVLGEFRRAYGDAAPRGKRRR